MDVVPPDTDALWSAGGARPVKDVMLAADVNLTGEA